MGHTGKTTSNASRRLRKDSDIASALRAFSRRDDRPEVRRYEIGGDLAAQLKEEADGRGTTEHYVLEEAMRLYLAGRRNGGER